MKNKLNTAFSLRRRWHAVTDEVSNKNIFKKTLSLLLSLIMLFSITAGIDLSAYANENSSVESISYELNKPIEYVENICYYEYLNNGDWWETDKNGDEYFNYHCSIDDRIWEGILTVNYSNGNSVKYSYNDDIGEWIDSQGNELDCWVYFRDSQEYYCNYTLGDDIYFWVYYEGAYSEDIPVAIIENPVKSIAYKPVVPFKQYKNSNNTWVIEENNLDRLSYHSPYYLDGNILTVNYKNGSSVDYIYNSSKNKYISKNGEVLDELYDELYPVEYDDYATFEYLNVKTEIPVTILENPVKSIYQDTVIADKKDFMYSDNGINFYDYFHDNKNVLIINFKDGTSSEFTYYEGVGGGLSFGVPCGIALYKDAKGNEIIVEGSCVCEDTKLNKTYYTIKAMGFEIEVPVIFAGDCTHKWDKGKVTKKATCKATGVKTYTCTECGETKTESIAKTAHTYKTTTTKATTSKNGKIVKKCTVCGESTTTTIYYPKTVTFSATSYTYDGKAKKPTITVKDSKGKKIAASNYTAKYTNNKNVGKATVTITFKGNYSGTVKKTFTIKPKATTLSSVTAGKKKFTVKWKKQATQTTGYQIQYSTSSKFTNAKTVTVSKNKTTSKSVSKLSAKKKYYVRVRTYKTVKVNGKSTKIYSSWSKSKAVTTKK